MTRRKVGACVPCHTRKVACDAQQRGTPCSRCEKKGLTGLCMPAARSASDAKRLHQQKVAPELDLETSEQGGQTGTDIGVNDGAFEKPVAIMKEHYKDYNPYVLLGEAFGKPRRLGLVSPEYPNDMLALEREMSLVDSADKEYMQQKRIYNMPAKHISDELVSLFYEHVYIHFPILDRPHFQSSYHQSTCSTFLLYSLYAATIPYASAQLIQDLGFVTAQAAQGEFFCRAKVLHGLGCELSELALLQGTILLCSFTHFLDQTKDFRFWKCNAIRLAVQMGLRSREICNVLTQSMTRLYRRMWWTVIQLDVSSVISGLEPVRFIRDEETDTPIIATEDFDEAAGVVRSDIPAITSDQKQFFVLKCQLAQLG
ncbi:hypothetical protein K402DRAFT_98086 [Aulographum hederae CBS 113979]|uniref:Zn(2)-C6 fungal-type domain-containing protein n=1 Tax=Aulographum hederae CBS 113979 TaxID=1176131 RepID=A0A6G1GYK6_9PEZI|nr:hypothetical protein K402DRAFT_98086 [Aulographum hederae CBS 113979]